MDSLRSFVYKLALCLGLPWLIMVVVPYARQQNLQPVPYADADVEANADLRGGVFPMAISGDKKRGQEVYFSEGCAQCHTQVIRPTYAGWDQWKRGWGSNQDPTGTSQTRQTTPWDYLHEDFAAIGQRRIGPDLANAAYRSKSAAELHAKLFAPRSVAHWSVMPSYRHLYQIKKIEGGVRADAIPLPKEAGVPDGYQVVPGDSAKALAEYLLALKRDLPLPVAISGAKPAAEAKK